MKIVQFIFSLCPGGAERFVVSLSNQLAELGHDVTLCILRTRNKAENIFNLQYINDKVQFLSLEIEPGFSLSKVKEVESYLLKIKPDVVHCHLNVIPYIYRLSITSKGVKFIHTLHSVAENTSGIPIQKPINRFFYRKNHIIPVTISDKCKKSYVKYYDLTDPYLIINGCENPLRSKEFPSIASEIASYKSRRQTPVFIHVARYHKLKNQRLLIDSFNRLDALGYDFVLLIIGSGFSEGEGEQLKHDACAKIHFLGVKNNVADYLYLSNAFCLTSLHEGLPISLLEAIGCGVVPICTKAGGIPDVIIDGVSGYLSEEITVESYVAALLRFIEGDVIINSSILIKNFHEFYSMDNCARKYLDLYVKNK